MRFIVDSVFYFYKLAVRGECLDSVDSSVLEFCKERKYHHALNLFKNDEHLTGKHRLLKAMVEYQIQPNPNIGELFELIKTAEACIQIESLLIVSKLILSSQQFGHPHWLPAIASSIDFLENTIDKTDAVQCARLSELIALFHFNKKDYAQSAKIFDGICELLESQKSEFPQNFITELLLESAVVSSNTGSTAETFRKFVTAAQTEHGAEDDAIRLAEIYAYFGCFLMKTDVKKAFAAFDKALDYYNQLPENSKLERLVVLRYMHMLVTQGAVKADLKSLADQIDCCLQGS